MRQERVEVQHSEAEDRADKERLLVGSEDRTMSTKRFWNSALPIPGVTNDVAPGGAQSVYPLPHAPPTCPRVRAAKFADARIANCNRCRRMVINNG